jgi:hypothetical protein
VRGVTSTGRKSAISFAKQPILASTGRCSARNACGMPTHTLAESISERIFLLRGRRILLDSALAELYGVTTKRLNEQVRRNRARFPEDFLLELTRDEVVNLRSHFATSSWGGRRSQPLAFTEHGAIMVANILILARRGKVEW